MRKASINDRSFVAECFIHISRYAKSQASDIYIDGLPDKVDEQTLKIAESYINDSNALTLITERQGMAVACIAAKVEETSFVPSGVGLVGNIAICWVSPDHRKQNIAAELVRAVEDWLGSQGVGVVELSYLAQNALADVAWNRIGFKPFRVFAHKLL